MQSFCVNVNLEAITKLECFNLLRDFVIFLSLLLQLSDTLCNFLNELIVCVQIYFTNLCVRVSVCTFENLIFIPKAVRCEEVRMIVLVVMALRVLFHCVMLLCTWKRTCKHFIL